MVTAVTVTIFSDKTQGCFQRHLVFYAAEDELATVEVENQLLGGDALQGQGAEVSAGVYNLCHLFHHFIAHAATIIAFCAGGEIDLILCVLRKAGIELAHLGFFEVELPFDFLIFIE